MAVFAILRTVGSMLVSRLIIWLLSLMSGSSVGVGAGEVGVISSDTPLTGSVVGIVSNVAGATLSILDPSMRDAVVVETSATSRIYVWDDGHRLRGNASFFRPGARVSGEVVDGVLVSADVESVALDCSAARGVVRGLNFELPGGEEVSFRDSARAYVRDKNRLPVDIADVDGEEVVISICGGFARIAYSSS